MNAKIMKGLLLDASYFDDEKKSKIALYVNFGAERKWVFDEKFSPYFYVLVGKNDKNQLIKEISSYKIGEEGFSVKSVEETKMQFHGKEALKVSFNKVSQLVQARKIFKDFGLNCFEYDIPFGKRYLIDNALQPGSLVELELEDDKIRRIVRKEISEEPEIKMVSFDLETWFGKQFIIGGEPILMASIVGEEKSRVISYETKKVNNLEIVGNEKELIKEVEKELNDCDVIVTYNGDNFDFAYIKERAKKLKQEFKINGEEPRIIRMGLSNAVKLSGIQHVDSYEIIKFLQRTGAINIVKLDIENVSEKVFGIKKEKVYPSEINEAWKTGEKLERVVDYNLKDSQIALRIAKEFLPLFIEISRLTSQTLFDTTRDSTSEMIEDLLLKESHKRGMITPNKPNENEVNERTNNPIKGAFVKEPLAGLHENIAVLDFASLYPSIIISHNISPETLNCNHKECEKNKSPDGTWFCTKEKGLFPEILERLLKQRLKLKAEYKKKKKEGIDDKILFAKQWALKIILNSVYGYLGYARSRRYSRECASAITAWARSYIHKAIKDAEEYGFKVIYSDTDSTFLLMNKKTKEDVEEFVKKINASLPETMELEIEGFYKRGIFVTKRGTEKEGKEIGAAKKKYALIDEKGNLKIVGFEYVRRDWCNIAKETQRRVIELILSEGKPEKAIEYVRSIIKELKEGKAKKTDLAIMTMLKRKVKDYSATGPHVSAAEKAIQRGQKLTEGSLLSFIITKNGKSISEKAELEEYVKEGDYDADYYIENQVIPAVIKIIQELGYTKEDLIHGGRQTGLGMWS